MKLRILRSLSAGVVLLTPSLAIAQDDVGADTAAETPEEPTEEPTDVGADASTSLGVSASTDDQAARAAGTADVAGQGAAAPAPAESTPPPIDAELDRDLNDLYGFPGTPNRPEKNIFAAFNSRLFGFAGLNVIHDSTQSFLFPHNNPIARPGTFAGDHDQLQLSARDSRLGFHIVTPEFDSIRAHIYVEVDFQGVLPTDTSEANFYGFGPMRMRHYFVKLETPIVDILAGQYHDLFGWGGAGFYPTTAAFLGVSGQIFNRQAQLRVSKDWVSDDAALRVAVAAMRPVQRSSGVPDGEAGIRFAVPSWKGVQSQAYSMPTQGSFALGVSGILRKFEVTEFSQNSGEPRETLGWGLAGSLNIPVIPISDFKDRSNALTFVGEAVIGTGISDMYTALTGGAAFPVLQNPLNVNPPPVYTPNVDNGVVTYDGNNDLQSINWQSFVLNLAYHLPIQKGRVWIAGTYTRLYSDNLVELTPVPSRGGVFAQAQYIDGSVFFALTPTIQLNGSYQITMQTYNDGIVAQNNRTQFGIYAYF